jgi:hypothetical protein
VVTDSSDSDSAPPPEGHQPPPGGYRTPPGGFTPGGDGAGFGSSGGSGRPAAPKPGVIPLRPLALGEILDGAIAAIRVNPATMLVASAVAAIAVNVVIAVVSRAGLNLLGAGNTIRHWGTVLAVMAVIDLVVVLVLRTVLAGLLAVAVGEAVLGRKVPLSQAWRAARARIGALAGTALLSAGLLILGWALLTGLAVGAGYAIRSVTHLAAAGVLVGIAGGLIAAVFAAMTLVRWSVAIPVTMLEGSGPAASLRRSWGLVRDSSWRVLWAELVAGVIAGIAGLLVQLVFHLAGGGFLIAVAASWSVPGTLASAAGGIISTMLTAPFLAGVGVLLYTDLRMRREGLDVTLQAAAASGAPGFGPPGPG